MPATLSLTSPPLAQAVLEWLPSMDMPLVLSLATMVCTGILSRAARADAYRWIVPASNARTVRLILLAFTLAPVLRWPFVLVLAGILLSVGGPDAQALRELLVISMFGLVWGVVLGLLLLRKLEVGMDARPSRGRGLAALSWAPLHEVRRRLHLRRLSLLAMPILLAAPMGAPSGQVALALAAWVPLLFFAAAMREAAHTVAAMRRWLPWSQLRPLQLRWWAWRLVITAGVISTIAVWATWWTVKS